ncbi:MAG: RHS repeat-associated core domain-containing protein, partial [Verrucomicrobiota bacterium]
NGAVLLTYDGDGHRVKKVAGSTTTLYLVATVNPTGYAQVVEELTVSGSVTNLSKAFVVGLDLISQRQSNGTVNYYGYDGLGSVRFLLNSSGTITDTYTYDAYGTLIASTETTPNDYRYTGEQWDANLGMYFLRARYMNPGLGRFWTMDSYEGAQGDPVSLHKYVYCAADPVNNVDPSGHFMEGTGGLLLTTALQKGLRGLQATSMTVPGHIAARGFMKWAWLAGGIGAGVQTLMQDTQFAMDMQLMMQSNPTGSKWAYENLKCVEFATDAMAYFQTNTRRRGQPQRITYDMNPGMGPGFIMAKENFGFFGGQTISLNGHHEGVLHDRRVYDNNVPFGVSRTNWEEGYELFIRGHGEMSIGESARKGFGVIKVE